jgi:hypothetical protein
VSANRMPTSSSWIWTASPPSTEGAVVESRATGTLRNRIPRNQRMRQHRIGRNGGNGGGNKGMDCAHGYRRV